MAEGAQGSTKEAVEAIVESMLYCSKCDKYSLKTFAYIACDHVICDECAPPNQPSTTCPLCGKKSTQMNVAADAKFLRLRSLTTQLADLMQIKCEQKRLATKDTGAKEYIKKGKPNVGNDLKVAAQEPGGKDASASDGVKKQTRARGNNKKTPNEMAVPASDSDKLILMKNLRNKTSTVETKGANLVSGNSNHSDKIDTVETSELIQPKRSSKKVTVIPTASETILIPDENNDLPGAGLTSPKPKSNETRNGTPKVIKLNRSKFQARLGSEAPADYTAAENHRTPHRVRRQTPKAAQKKTADQDAEQADGKKDVASPMKSVRNVKRMSTLRTEKRNTRGETPLHVACIRGDLRKVRSLIAEGADVNSIDNAHWSPLHEAAQRGFVDIARCLVVAGGLTNVPGVGNTTPLHDAVTHDRVDMVELLVQLGADTDARNSNGKKPIDLATTEVMRAAFAVHGVARPPAKPKLAPVVDRHMVVFADKPIWLAHQAELSAVAKLLDQKIAIKLARDVTHVVAEMGRDNACKPTPSILHAMLLGATIVSESWVLKCAESGCIIDPLLFEVGGTTNFPTSNAPSRARLNARNQLPSLFDNCSFFLRHMTADYVSGDLSLTKTELVSLIKVGGGTVLLREPNPENISKKEVLCPYHARAGGPLEHCTQYIIYQPGDDKIKYNMQHIKALPLEWLVDCLESFALLDHVPYLQITVD